jgi:hypothetical protein
MDHIRGTINFIYYTISQIFVTKMTSHVFSCLSYTKVHRGSLPRSVVGIAAVVGTLSLILNLIGARNFEKFYDLFVRQ